MSITAHPDRQVRAIVLHVSGSSGVSMPRRHFSATSVSAVAAVCEQLESRWLLASPGTISEIQLATGSNPEKVVVGHDGSIYIYEQGTEKLARMRPGKSTFQEVDI